MLNYCFDKFTNNWQDNLAENLIFSPLNFSFNNLDGFLKPIKPFSNFSEISKFESNI